MMWPRVPIGDLCLPTETKDPRDEADQPFLYVDIASIDRQLKTIGAFSQLIGAEAPSRARKVIQANDVLVSTVRPNLNAVAIVPRELDGQIASTGFCVLRPRPGVLHHKFLFYFAVTPEFVDELSSRVRGAHYPAVSDGDVKKLAIPLPPISEQRQIVKILDQADALRKKRAEADAKAARILPALFYKMFGDPATNPKGWPMKALSALGASVRYGLGQPPTFSPAGVPFIRATNISRGRIEAQNVLTVDPKSVPSGRDAFLRVGEVIVVRSGAYTGDVAQVTDRWSGSVIGYDLVVSPGPRLTGEFLEAYLLSPFIQNGYFANAKARAGQPHLNAEQLAATLVLDVPVDLQAYFAKCVQTCRGTRDEHLQCERKLNALFSTLLHRAFTGDLTTRWREAHMKELLAEMEAQARILEAVR
jgi:type I restriction enzyme S subunit